MQRAAGGPSSGSLACLVASRYYGPRATLFRDLALDIRGYAESTCARLVSGGFWTLCSVAYSSTSGLITSASGNA